MSVRESITAEQIAKYTELVEPKKKLRKKGGRAMLIFFLVCVVIGAVIGFFGPMLMDKGVIKLDLKPPFKVSENLVFIYPIVLFLYYYVTMVLHTVIHEGGHLVFGLLTGYRFLSFRVFSFTIIKKDGKISRKKLKVPGTMGQCLLIPPEWKEDERYPYVWYNLGGGLMNMIFCFLVIPLFFLHSPLLAWIAGIFVFTGVIFALSNLIPMTMGIPNDGKNCLMCAKERENQRAFYLQLKLNAMLSDGVLFDALPDELLSVRGDKPVNALTCFIDLMRFYKHLYHGEEEAADACLAEMEQCLDKLPTGFANSIDLERLYLMLLNEVSVEEVAAYYAVLQPVFLQVKDISVLRVKYLYYLFLSDEERETIEWLVRSKKGKLPKRLPKQKPVTAEKIYEEMEKAYEKHPVIGEAELHMSLVRERKEEVAEQGEAETEASVEPGDMSEEPKE